MNLNPSPTVNTCYQSFLLLLIVTWTGIRIPPSGAVIWTDRVNEYITSASKVAGTSLAVDDWANQSVAESPITNFEEVCEDGCSSDSRSGMRWALYMQAP